MRASLGLAARVDEEGGIVARVARIARLDQPCSLLVDRASPEGRPFLVADDVAASKALDPAFSGGDVGRGSVAVVPEHESV